MSGEWPLVWLVPVRLGVVLIFALLYAIGGRGPKYVRRFIGGAFLGSALIGISLLTGHFQWWLTALPGLYVVSLCLGYGGKTFREKLRRRLIYGSSLGACALVVASATPVWDLGVLQFLLAVVASAYLGIRNPIQAVNEEALIATLSVVAVPFMV